MHDIKPEWKYCYKIQLKFLTLSLSLHLSLHFHFFNSFLFILYFTNFHFLSWKAIECQQEVILWTFFYLHLNYGKLLLNLYLRYIYSYRVLRVTLVRSFSSLLICLNFKIYYIYYLSKYLFSVSVLTLLNDLFLCVCFKE